MTPRDFTYWLQGYLELGGKEFNEEQVNVIKEHIALVLKKETSVPQPLNLFSFDKLNRNDDVFVDGIKFGTKYVWDFDNNKWIEVDIRDERTGWNSLALLPEWSGGPNIKWDSQARTYVQVLEKADNFKGVYSRNSLLYYPDGPPASC